MGDPWRPGDPQRVSLHRHLQRLDYPGRPALAPTGRKLQISGMDRSEIQDSRLARHQIFWDAAELGRQMGLLPARNSAAERVGLRLQHLAARRIRRQNHI